MLPIPRPSTSLDIINVDLSEPEDVPTDEAEGGPQQGRRWTSKDRNVLFQYLMGPDADNIFERLQKGPTNTFKQVRCSMHGM